MSRKFAVGDIHGAAKALDQVLERSPFDPEEDTLVCLGDVVDGWPETAEAVERLLDIPNLILLRGNHDQWFLEWVRFKIPQQIWTSQGGEATLQSYNYMMPPETHVDFFEAAHYYHIDEERNFCFVHAGWPSGFSIENAPKDTLIWTRGMWERAVREQESFTPFDRIFIGHTAVSSTPVKRAKIWNLDTGAGWNGKLTMMDVDTEEYWQSDFVKTLYPNYAGRRE